MIPSLIQLVDALLPLNPVRWPAYVGGSVFSQDLKNKVDAVSVPWHNVEVSANYIADSHNSSHFIRRVAEVTKDTIDVIQELDSKQRKIRSLRGFFLYALEIMEKGKNYEIFSTNLQPFFWDLRSNSSKCYSTK